MFISLLLVIAAIPVAFYCSNLHRRWWFLDPINTFWPLYILFGVVQPWVSHDGWIEVYGKSAVYWTLAMYVLAGVAVCFGYALPTGRKAAQKLPLIQGFDDESRFIRLGFAAVIIGALDYAYVIHMSGGLEKFLSISRNSINREEIGGYALTLLTFLPLGLMILLCTTYYHPRHIFLKKLVLVAMAAFGVWCIYSGTRSGIISVVLIMLGSVYGARRRNPPVLISALAFGAVLVLVGFVTQYRGAMYGGQFHSEDSASATLDRSVKWYSETEQDATPLGSEFGTALAVVAYVPNTVHYDYGYMLLDFLTMPVPRAFWPQKVYPGGESWDRLFRVSGTAGWVNTAGLLSGPAPSLIGKYYYMAGPLGVLLGGLWTGVFLQLMRSYVARYPGVTGVLLAVACFNLGFSEMNNPLLWPISWLPATGVAILLVAWLGRKGRRNWERARIIRRRPTLIRVPYSKSGMR